MLKMVAHSPEKIVKHAQFFMQNEKHASNNMEFSFKSCREGSL